MDSKLICISIDIMMILSYIIIGFLFLKSSGKACNFIAGYNMKSQEERNNYDEVKICKYFGITIMSWAIPFIIGVVLDLFLAGVGITTAFVFLTIAIIYHVFQSRNKVFDKKFRKNENLIR
jgi:dipeptide/tripeptide permease